MFSVLGLGIASSFSESLRDEKYFGVSSEFLVKVFTQAVLLNEPNIADIFWITDLFMLDISVAKPPNSGNLQRFLVVVIITCSLYIH